MNTSLPLTQRALNVYAAQLNTTVGDFAGNAAKILEAARKAAEQGADVMLTPEQSITGYPLHDLSLRRDFVETAEAWANWLATELPPELTVIYGGVSMAKKDWELKRARHGQIALNSAFVAQGGKVVAISNKSILPIGGEFDEPRLFTTGEAAIVKVKDVLVGIPICEDIWHPEVCKKLFEQGAEVLLVSNSSPVHENKVEARHAIVRKRVEETGIPLLYVNQVGGQDEFIFDGGSFLMNPGDETPSAIMPYYKEAGQMFTLQRQKSQGKAKSRPGHWVLGEVTPDKPITDEHTFIPSKVNILEKDDYTYQAALTGIRDYVAKTGAAPGGVLVGHSGGIDSALTAVMAVDALGADKVKAVRLPTRYTSKESMDLAEEACAKLGIQMETVDIQPAIDALSASVAKARSGTGLSGIAAENIQARMRMNVLMSMANDEGRLVLGTGNWSETSVGYATVGGDMVCGLNVLKGLKKTRVFDISQWVNYKAGFERIPQRIITRPPSAELRDGQMDTDSLPPYPVLDDILSRYVRRQSLNEITELGGHNPDVVSRVIALLYGAEFKRRGPVGLNIGEGSFDRKWDMPVAAHRSLRNMPMPPQTTQLKEGAGR